MTLFEKIIAREIPADIVYEDDFCLCFHDISPQAPVHLLLIPKKPVARIAETSADDQLLLGHLLLKVGEIARQEGYAEDGFRVIINNGPHGGEAVPHLHLHLLAGRQLQWPPG
ncbi:MAG TPA: histidine triad nucleotide-binding protein [Verrucomicrobiales bacterium]|nr:histidine triad nucleotide-binding protein [Verrucomicrobiales bacterium]